MFVCHVGIWRNANKAHCTLNLTLYAMSACNLNALYNSNSHQHPPHRRMGMARSHYKQREKRNIYLVPNTLSSSMLFSHRINWATIDKIRVSCKLSMLYATATAISTHHIGEWGWLAATISNVKSGTYISSQIPCHLACSLVTALSELPSIKSGYLTNYLIHKNYFATVIINLPIRHGPRNGFLHVKPSLTGERAVFLWFRVLDGVVWPNHVHHL